MPLPTTKNTSSVKPNTNSLASTFVSSMCNIRRSSALTATGERPPPIHGICGCSKHRIDVFDDVIPRFPDVARGVLEVERRVVEERGEGGLGCVVGACV